LLDFVIALCFLSKSRCRSISPYNPPRLRVRLSAKVSVGQHFESQRPFAFMALAMDESYYCKTADKLKVLGDAPHHNVGRRVYECPVGGRAPSTN
jgi:hypothetical protein